MESRNESLMYVEEAGVGKDLNLVKEYFKCYKFEKLGYVFDTESRTAWKKKRQLTFAKQSEILKEV